MAWRLQLASVSVGGRVQGGLAAASAIAAVLVLACLALLLTAPMGGDFWWQDAPRHALNGVFIKDLVAAHPIADPAQWAIRYYLMRPALTIAFYPPLFYGIEAIAFTLFGVSHFVAQAAVTLFIGVLAGGVYVLSRAVLPRWSAVGAALLAIGTPGAALWGRQVMLDLPAYALIAISACFLVSYLKKGRPPAIYLSALFLVAGIYTKYNAGFIAPALVVAFVVAKGKAAWHDRHALTAAAFACAGGVLALFMMRKMGAINAQSISGLQGSLPLDSLECWLYYIRALPAQLGVLTLVLATGGVALFVRRIVTCTDRWIYGLFLAWLLVGYLVFSAISLKEERDTLMVLLPLAIAAVLFLHRIIPKPFNEFGGLALGVGTLAYSLIFCPVPRVGGYHDIAMYLATNVPLNGVVAYSGYRDANLIFDLAAIPGRSDISIVRVDKLLLSVPVGERRRGVTQTDYDEAGISRLLRDLGASYFVIQPGFWSDLQVMARFDTVIKGPDYEKVWHADLTGTLSTQDGTAGIDILRPTYPATEGKAHLDIDMPLAGQRFQGTLHP